MLLSMVERKYSDSTGSDSTKIQATFYGRPQNTLPECLWHLGYTLSKPLRHPTQVPGDDVKIEIQVAMPY